MHSTFKREAFDCTWLHWPRNPRSYPTLDGFEYKRHSADLVHRHGRRTQWRAQVLDLNPTTTACITGPVIIYPPKYLGSHYKAPIKHQGPLLRVSPRVSTPTPPKPWYFKTFGMGFQVTSLESKGFSTGVAVTGSELWAHDIEWVYRDFEFGAHTKGPSDLLRMETSFQSSIVNGDGPWPGRKPGVLRRSLQLPDLLRGLLILMPSSYYRLGCI